MGLTNDNIPEGKKKELLDMAYNILPEGADYDVFSENASKEVKPTLLYNDISSEPPKKLREIRQKNECKQENERKKENNLNKPEISNGAYDMFAENADLNPAPAKPINREYLDRLYKGGIEISEDTILMTRSDYIADYNRINEYYDGEKKKCKKNFLGVAIIFAFGIAVLYIIELLQLNTPVEIVPRVVNPIYRILNGIRAGVFVANPIVSGFFFISTIKSMKNIKKSRKKAIDRLEQRKQELMILGLYDLSN